MHLAVLADDVAGAVDQDRRVEAAFAIVLHGELGIAEIEADAELLRLVEQRLRLRPRHLLLVIAVELGLVLDQPAREECGQRHLREDDELGAPRLRLAHHGDQALDRILAGFGLGDRPHLGGSCVYDACHRFLLGLAGCRFVSGPLPARSARSPARSRAASRHHHDRRKRASSSACRWRRGRWATPRRKGRVCCPAWCCAAP